MRRTPLDIPWDIQARYLEKRKIQLACGGRLPCAAHMGASVLSGVYGGLMSLRNVCYTRRWKRIASAAVPVVSVGNLTTGGTGKTPFTVYLAKKMLALGRKVAILSRGYRADGTCNEEGREVQSHLPDVPVLQSPNRAALAEIAVAQHGVDVCVLDDGFQHRQLARDLDIVLIDATNPFGNGGLLPSGSLREPPCALARAHVVVLTRANLVTDDVLQALWRRIERVKPGLDIFASHHLIDAVMSPDGGRMGDPSALDGRSVIGLCAVGNPMAFLRMLQACRAMIGRLIVYPDHHHYTRQDMDRVLRVLDDTDECDLIVTTGKDMVKIRDCIDPGAPIAEIRTHMTIPDNEPRFLQWIENACDEGAVRPDPPPS